MIKIGYLASDLLTERIGQDGVDELVNRFLEHLPPDEVAWVDVGDLEWIGKTMPDEELPVYTCKNAEHCVIAYPATKEGQRILVFELREERPELEGELEW